MAWGTSDAGTVVCLWIRGWRLTRVEMGMEKGGAPEEVTQEWGFLLVESQDRARNQSISSASQAGPLHNTQVFG